MLCPHLAMCSERAFRHTLPPRVACRYDAAFCLLQCPRGLRLKRRELIFGQRSEGGGAGDKSVVEFTLCLAISGNDGHTFLISKKGPFLQPRSARTICSRLRRTPNGGPWDLQGCVRGGEIATPLLVACNGNGNFFFLLCHMPPTCTVA